MNKRKVPKIRFKGFYDDWEQRKLDEILIQRVEHQTISADAPLLAFSYADGVIDPEDKKSNKRDFIMADKYSKIFSRTELNDIIYNPANVIHGAIHRNKLGTGVVSPIYKIFVCNNVSPKYMGERLHTDIFIQEITKYIEGTVIKLRTLSPEMFLEMMVEIPSSYEEQEKIGKLFDYLDSLITLHQRKLEKLKIIKKSMLENCFPKNGEKVPKNRFSGFSDDWEQRKFGDVGSVAMCKRVFKEQTFDGGEVPFYKIGTFGGEPDAYISRELFDEYKAKYPYPNKGDVLISASGSIGRTVEFTGKDEYFQDSNIVWLKHGKDIDNSFLKILYSVIEWSCEGSTIKRLYNDNFLKTEFMLPQIDEQKKIGEYFNNLDHLITLHQSKLEKLKMIKKSMLETMFV